MRRAATRSGEAEQLRAMVTALVRRFALAERADVDCCGLTVAQAATLEALQGGPLRLGILAQTLGITASTLTRNLARLEAERLMVREADKQDSRAAQVRLTAEGERAAARVHEQEVQFIQGILDRLGPARSQEVLALLKDLLAAVRAATEECCPGAFDHLMEGFAVKGGGPRRSDVGESCGRK